MIDRFAQALKHTPLLNGLDMQDIERLAATAAPRKLKRKEPLFLEGEKVKGFFLVLEGLLKIYKVSADGKEHVLHLVPPGQTFAEGALFEFEGYPASAEAVEPSEVLMIPADGFISLLDSKPHLCHKMFKGLSLWLRRLTDIIYSLAFRDVEVRLASYLVQQCRQDRGGLRSGMKIDLGVEKSLLASYLGTIPETFSRTLKKMQLHGLIEVDGSVITILDAEGLQGMIGSE
ncbi:MAG TPA: Crp/Fnr family transcriptional regulator [Acidobacteriota bacterium]|nr:Crp/Fnr family transcriptional regulator [Acidobacteriota bacterium]